MRKGRKTAYRSKIVCKCSDCPYWNNQVHRRVVSVAKVFHRKIGSLGSIVELKDLISAGHLAVQRAYVYYDYNREDIQDVDPTDAFWKYARKGVVREIIKTIKLSSDIMPRRGVHGSYPTRVSLSSAQI